MNIPDERCIDIVRSNFALLRKMVDDLLPGHDSRILDSKNVLHIKVRRRDRYTYHVFRVIGGESVAMVLIAGDYERGEGVVARVNNIYPDQRPLDLAKVMLWSLVLLETKEDGDESH